MSPEIEYRLRSALENSIKVLEARLSQSSNMTVPQEPLVTLKNIQRRLAHNPSSEVLATGLKDADPEAQSRNLRLLSRRGECYGRAEPVLIAHLKSANADIAENAAICLKNYGAQAFNALPHLQTALTDPDPRVRDAASNAIGRITALCRDQGRSAR